ncbi:DNA-binding response regulator [Paenibacillus psychroresistens]|uniref:DNA-binding response regulator n=1 Tax=Paenibacillus psychroresistens TaxID=1778678 RepID=A0A6B8RFE7_9BACL|nr:DNA-binding response regulator [Paenibacillus psychroresistens]QGQ94839.1 DNA-binding response regulator [Paenibacillus psychroresistens]
MDMFEKEYRKWMDVHVAKRKGERRRKLAEGSNHAEKEMLRHIWWAAFGNFEFLHPEYEITDFFQGQRFLDFVYIRGPIRIVFEIDGYGPHLRDISRRQFCDERVRQMHLTNDNWIVIRIGFDDIKERPRLWIGLLQQMMGRLFGNPEQQLTQVDYLEREVIRFAIRENRAIKLRDLEKLFSFRYRAARTVIDRLVAKQWLIPASGGKERVHSWEVNVNNKQLPL